MTDAGIDVAHYDGVIPNPTLESITMGAIMAREFGAEVVIGLGGGSAMDSAKAISVEATHEGTSWDYLFYKSPQPDPKKLLPVIAVSTTSGTGSQVTQVAAITNTQERDKSALYNNILYPRVCIIDPELIVTLPQFVTAFVIDGIEEYPNSVLTIMSRYGKTVYVATGYQNDWEGEKLSSGVYYWGLELNEPRAPIDKINGQVSILR